MQKCIQSDDGWDSEEEIKIIQLKESPFIRFRGDKALNILNSNHHSLQPDMISGWRPKLPSCPLPLSYINPYVDSLKKLLMKHETYRIVYVGQRLANSVQVNQRYSYYWKHRERYSLNIDIIKNAINKVGIEKVQDPQIEETPYQFDSSFQSGNLDMAVKIKKDQFDCFIRSDTNTKGHSNWYYFRVKNRGEAGPVKFNICNMTKCKNLYTQGMKPYCRLGQQGEWTQNPCYNVNFVERLCRQGFQVKAHQLQFTFNFTQPNQQVYFAYSIPYTYSNLQKFLTSIRKQKCVKITSLCQSLGGIQLPLITIDNTQFFSNGKQNMPASQKVIRKKVALITARIHPGQSNSSHLLEGFVKQLLNNHPDSLSLLNHFVFYVIPMLNPDGVIVGNFRTSYSGKDLNRQFKKLNKFIFPQIYALGQLCQKIRKSYHKSIQFYFDFHGHSSKKNLFCYGPEYSIKDTYYFKARTLAKLIQKIQPMFNYKDSIFTINEQKKTTARAYMLWKLGIPMAFTFQMSNGLLGDSDKNTTFLSKQEIIKAGSSLVKGLFRYTQIQMRLPQRQIKAKVDSGKYQSRKLKLSSINRQKLNSQHKVRQFSQKFPRREEHQIKRNQNQLWNDCAQEKDIIELMKQIKLEINTNKNKSNEEGGSDSEASNQDFTSAQSNKLFKFIVDRKNVQNYNKNNMGETKQGKYLMKIEQTNQIENIQRQSISVVRRYESNKLIQKPKNALRSMQIRASVERQRILVPQKHFTMFI